mmetsp:Transcript_16246/g.32668  ORF Transcript_16246/g.32668 Transcript_16246/m.32668 type:complete len:145 (-) Transcript_16246:625-1059(-)
MVRPPRSPGAAVWSLVPQSSSVEGTTLGPVLNNSTIYNVYVHMTHAMHHFTHTPTLRRPHQHVLHASLSFRFDLRVAAVDPRSTYQLTRDDKETHLKRPLLMYIMRPSSLLLRVEAQAVHDSTQWTRSVGLKNGASWARPSQLA